MDTSTDVQCEPADWRLRFALSLLLFTLGVAVSYRRSMYVGWCISYIGYEIMARTDGSRMGYVDINLTVSWPALVWMWIAVGVVVGFVLITD